MPIKMSSTFLNSFQLFITKFLVTYRVHFFIQLAINKSKITVFKYFILKSFFEIPKMLIIVLLYTARIKGFCNKNYSAGFLDLLDITSFEKFLSFW